MDKLSYGFWGCYFGITALMLAGISVAFVRSRHRIFLNAALSIIASNIFVLAFLGVLPIGEGDTLQRVLAHVSLGAALLMAYLLFGMLGVPDRRRGRRVTFRALTLLGAVGLLLGWLLPAGASLMLSMGMAACLGFFAMGVSLYCARRGDRSAWRAVFAVSFTQVCMFFMGWIALAQGPVAWPLHAAAALGGTGYLVMMASALWVRYFYLMELRQIMAHGPSYDPVTRLRSHSETGYMLGHAFRERQQAPSALGMLVVSIGNLYALEKLHGKAAVNHALFVCAGRLRRVVPHQVELGRFGEDAFVLLMRDCRDSGTLVRLAHRVVSRLAKRVILNTSLASARREREQTPWQAGIGVGVVRVAQQHATMTRTLATARAMSRTALSYASRVAWADPASGEAVELPGLDRG